MLKPWRSGTSALVSLGLGHGQGAKEILKFASNSLLPTALGTHMAALGDLAGDLSVKWCGVSEFQL